MPTLSVVDDLKVFEEDLTPRRPAIDSSAVVGDPDCLTTVVNGIDQVEARVPRHADENDVSDLES